MKNYLIASGIIFLSLSPLAKAEDGAWNKAYPQEESFVDGAKIWAPIAAEGLAGAGALVPAGILAHANDEIREAAKATAEERFIAGHPSEAKLLSRRHYVADHQEFFATPPKGTEREKLDFFNSPEQWNFEKEKMAVNRSYSQYEKIDAAIEKDAAQILADLKEGRPMPAPMQLAIKKSGVMKTLVGFKISLAALLLADTSRRINKALSTPAPGYSEAIETSRALQVKHPWVDLSLEDPHASDTSMNSHE